MTLFLSSTYVTKFSTIHLYLTKFYVTESFAAFAKALAVNYSEIRQNLSNCAADPHENCVIYLLPDAAEHGGQGQDGCHPHT